MYCQTRGDSSDFVVGVNQNKVRKRYLSRPRSQRLNEKIVVSLRITNMDILYSIINSVLCALVISVSVGVIPKILSLETGIGVPSGITQLLAVFVSALLSIAVYSRIGRHELCVKTYMDLMAYIRYVAMSLTGTANKRTAKTKQIVVVIGECLQVMVHSAQSSAIGTKIDLNSMNLRENIQDILESRANDSMDSHERMLRDCHVTDLVYSSCCRFVNDLSLEDDSVSSDQVCKILQKCYSYHSRLVASSTNTNIRFVKRFSRVLLCLWIIMSLFESPVLHSQFWSTACILFVCLVHEAVFCGSEVAVTSHDIEKITNHTSDTVDLLVADWIMVDTVVGELYKKCGRGDAPFIFKR